jgi:two-component system sensor histidine kinase YesM
LTLYRKIFFLLLISVYIPVFLLGYLSYNRYGQQLEKAAAAFLSDNLQHNVQRVDEWFDEVERRSVDIYTSDQLQQLLLSTKNGMIQQAEFIYELSKIRHLFAGPYDLNIYPVDMDKYPNYSALKNNMPLTDGKWFDQALKSDGRGFWIYETSEEYGVNYADFYYIRAIRSITLGFENLGVMVIRVPSKYVQGRMVSNKQYASYKLTVIDDSGRNLLEPESPFGEAFFGKITMGGQRDQFQLITERNVDYFADSLPLRYNGWRMAAIIPVTDVIGPIQSIQTYTWIVLSASLAVITLLLAFITRNVTVPIQSLVRYMKKVHQGVLERSLTYAGRRDEIGQLVGGYNSMIGGMQDLLETTRQSEQEKRKLELQMLLHQINPHFLYNTLDAIKWKAQTAQETGIAEMVTSLADLLRFSLNDGMEMTTLEREIEHVKSYVNIEWLRKGGFQVMYHIQPHILNAPYMKLIIQPIVENAIRHGLDGLPNGEGKLLISIYRDGQDIICKVEDNGPGCSQEELDRLNRMLSDGTLVPQNGHGLGMPNVFRRLRVSYGLPYGIHLENKITSGLAVTIRHPLLASSP